MKKLKLFFALLFVQILFSQIKFEKGYFIDNSGNKIECLIKNIDWNYNPKSFEYKLFDSDNERQNEIKNIKEFGIYNSSKFTKFDVQIDRTSENLNKLGISKEPHYKNETLLLKTIVEGDINLYLYNDNNTKRFFYGKPNENPKQLVYLIYNNAEESKIGYNVYFKDQIKENLQCSSISKFDIDKLQYKENSLTNIFIKYNKCNNPAFVSNSMRKKMKFSLNIRPRLSFSSLSTGLGEYYKADFDNNSTFGLGIEAEVFMPFNKNKWSVIIEPQYQYYKADKSFDADYVSGKYVIAKADYKSIDIPLGIRHYFFLNDKSKIFINALYSFNFNINSSLAYERNDGSKLFNLDMKSRGNFIFGAGYKYNKLSFEFRVNTNRDVLSDYPYWNSSFKSTSIILGYSLF